MLRELPLLNKVLHEPNALAAEVDSGYKHDSNIRHKPVAKGIATTDDEHCTPKFARVRLELNTSEWLQSAY
jgi:hypothetical protein